ncbi:MAG: D-alanyl-D-alanine carboxypeptidase [Hyphomicrobiaceae bacterium]
MPSDALRRVLGSWLSRPLRVATAFVALALVASPVVVAGPRDATMVLDANTGRVLHERDADEPRYPASLTKMMTLYVVFGEIEAGRMSYGTKIKISEHAAAQAPSKLDLDPGEEITAINAIKALITKSANDIAVALAEHVAGSEPAFARLMTERAGQIGMSRTFFRNASGLPDADQVTTARDMITLGLRLHDDFPRHWSLFATRSFPYEGNTYRNHNTLLGTYEGVEGIKTGYTRMSGFNIVTSVRRGGKHVVAAVFGGPTAAARNATARVLLDRAMLQASVIKTRRPAPMLVASAKPAARPASVAAAEMPAAPAPLRAEAAAPRPVVRSVAPPAAAAAPAAPRAAAAAPVAAVAAARAPQPVARIDETDRAGIALLFAEAAHQPSIEVVNVRRVALAPRDNPEGSVAPAGGAAEPSDVQAGGSASGRAPRFASVRMTAPPASDDAGPPPGRPPSTLEAQVRFFATDEPAPATVSPVALAAQPAVTAVGQGGDFQLQIGAFATVGEAERMLSATRARTGDLLRPYREVAIAVQKDNRRLYRARFTGFEAAAAQGVCTELRRQKIDCFVMKAE